MARGGGRWGGSWGGSWLWLRAAVLCAVATAEGADKPGVATADATANATAKKWEAVEPQYSQKHYDSTEAYWNIRYRDGSSFAVGSIDPKFQTYPEPPDHYKARTVYLKTMLLDFPMVETVIEFGCGDGVQAFMTLESAPQIKRYVGLDISSLAIHRITGSTDVVGDLKAIDPDREIEVEFYHYRGYHLPRPVRRRQGQFDVAFSLQVIMHILEDSLYLAYMKLLFSASRYLVLIQNENVARGKANHMHWRRFRDWVAANATDWTLYAWTPVSKFCLSCPKSEDAMWLYVHNDFLAR